MKLEQAIHCFKEAMIQENVSPEKGLGTEGFRFASTLIPVVNVDFFFRGEMIHIAELVGIFPVDVFVSWKQCKIAYKRLLYLSWEQM